MIANAGDSDIQREDFRIDDGNGPVLAIREVRDRQRDARHALVLIHGGGPGGVASFDLPVPGYSLAEDFASWFDVYVMDIRGWGNSAKPTVMEQPTDANPPAVCSAEAVTDIGRVVSWLRQERRPSSIALFGWATGGHWAAMFTTMHNQEVTGLVILNSLYGVKADWGLRAAFEDPAHPGQFDLRTGAYGLRTAEGLLASWDRTIPLVDKAAWRHPAVAEAYVREALASDPTSQQRQPPSLRIPSCFQRESYEMTQGRRFWQAADIRVPTLLVRGERDFWSRPVDHEVMAQELVNVPRAAQLTIADGTHYLFNDRPERGRNQLIQAVVSFFAIG